MLQGPERRKQMGAEISQKAGGSIGKEAWEGVRELWGSQAVVSPQ